MTLNANETAKLLGSVKLLAWAVSGLIAMGFAAGVWATSISGHIEAVAASTTAVSAKVANEDSKWDDINSSLAQIKNDLVWLKQASREKR